MTEEIKETTTTSVEESSEQVDKDFPSDWETPMSDSLDSEKDAVVEEESSESTEKQPSDDKKENKPEEKAPENEDHLPEELKTPANASEKDLKRIKGFQAAFTRKMQTLAEQEKSLQSQLREEYEAKFKEVVGRIAPQNISDTPSSPKTSLRDFFPDADPNQLKPLEDAFNSMIETKVKPLVQENEQLKQAFTARQQSELINQQWSNVKSSYGLEDNHLPDLVAWAHANPEAARGKTIEDIYKLSTWDKQKEFGKKEAVSELRQKEKESLETGSAPNTVENFEVKNIHDAMRMAEKELNAAKDRQKG